MPAKPIAAMGRSYKSGDVAKVRLDQVTVGLASRGLLTAVKASLGANP